ncbi:nucleotidyltransferase domain-containing protein [Sulfurihydrogenibium sp.]|uniref:nucleotidyltransferase domain-containing protein n=1 Tax=Sulfurihydrogenibium sp. TaxID=2053621 RepID=UPI0026343116|nr:nucleotidyltransferase domain-containing protein [Sulfurihydrogenibium sp.]
MKKHYLNRKEIKTLSELKSFVKSLDPMAKFMIFGSKVRGDYDEESDVDILIILNKNIDQEMILKKVFNLNMKNETEVNPIIINRKKWTKKFWDTIPLLKVVQKEGVEF